jgi:hypothetical protein
VERCYSLERIDPWSDPMRFKYTMEKRTKANELILKEFVETSDEKFTLLNEITYDRQKIESAVSNEKRNLLIALRNKNMYPPAIFADKLVEMTRSLINNKDQKLSEILVDDMDYFDGKRKPFKRRVEPVEEVPHGPDEMFEECDDESCDFNNDEDSELDIVRQIFPLDEVA